MIDAKRIVGVIALLLCLGSEIVSVLNSFGIYQMEKSKSFNLSFFFLFIFGAVCWIAYTTMDRWLLHCINVFSYILILVGLVALCSFFTYLIGIEYYFRRSGLFFLIGSGILGYIVHHVIQQTQLLKPPSYPETAS